MTHQVFLPDGVKCSLCNNYVVGRHNWTFTDNPEHVFYKRYPIFNNKYYFMCTYACRKQFELTPAIATSIECWMG